MRFILKFIGNFFWKLFGGVAYTAVWFFFAITLSLTIIGYPLGLRCFKIGYLVWKPFGKNVVLSIERYPISNIIWGLTAGLVLGLASFISGILFALSIFGLPLSKQWFKVSKLSFFPFGAYIK